MEKVVGNNNYLDTEFIHVNSRDCTLLIEFNENEFSFSIILNNKNEVLYSSESKIHIDFFNSTEKNLSEIIKNNSIFKFSYEKVIVLIDNLYSTLVPFDFFDDTKKEEILSFNVSLPKIDLVFKEDKLKKLDYYNVFVNTLHLENILKTYFVNFEMFSTKSILLDYAKNIVPKGEFLQMHISKNILHIIYFKNSELKFSNAFKYSNNEDVAFNILNVINSLGLNNERIILHLSGKIKKEDSLFDLLYMYVKNIEFMKKPLKLNYSERVQNNPEHFFLQHYITLL